MAGSLKFVHADHLGSSTIFSDTDGNEIGATQYMSYGQTRLQSCSIPTDKLFTGQTLEGYINLYFMGARSSWLDGISNGEGYVARFVCGSAGARYF